MSSALAKRINILESTIRAKAAEIAEERSNISYNLMLIPYDTDRKEPAHDAVGLPILFICPLHLKSVMPFRIGDDHETKRQFARRMGTAFGVSLEVSIACETNEVPCVSLKFASGALPVYDEEVLFVHNPYAAKAGNEDWPIFLSFDEDDGNRLVSVTLTHDPAKCKTLIERLMVDAVAVAETRLCNLLLATRELKLESADENGEDNSADEVAEKKRKLDDK